MSETKEGESYIQKNGRLSQWRAYGDYGIVFNKKELVDIVPIIKRRKKTAYAWGLDPVLYCDPAEQIHRETKVYDLLLDYVKKFKQVFLPQSPNTYPPDNDAAKPVLEAFIKILFLIKNKGFEEEKEHRLYIGYYDQETINQFYCNQGKKSTHFQNEHYEGITIRRNRIVPYINLFKNDPLPIEKILIGPAPDEEQKKREAGVNALIKHLKSIGSLKNDIPVHCSAIPYRG